MIATTDILAIVSMLHEPAEVNSATRRFRDEPVLVWTLRRLRRVGDVGAVVVVCWDDQLQAIAHITSQTKAEPHSLGQRTAVPTIAAVSAARRWADGWRGGPLGTSAFDLGFHPAAVKDLAARHAATAIVLIDPAAALIDPAIVDAVIAQHRLKPSAEFTFSPAATGLGAMLLTRPLVDRLAAAGSHPGRLLHYFPDQLSREPIAQDNCAPTPTPVARSPHRYTLTSRRQIEAIERATADLNGTLAGSAAEAIVGRMPTGVEPHPREVTLELTTRRLSRPIFSPLCTTDTGTDEPAGCHGLRYSAARGSPCVAEGHGQASTPAHGTPEMRVASPDPSLNRDDLPLSLARALIDELAATDDTRLTLAGVGDPLLHDDVLTIIEYAASRGLAVNVETDLLTPDTDRIDRLAESPADIVSIHLPALTAATYAAVMGVDAYTTALANVQRFVAKRAAAGRGTPLVLPIFTKCQANLAEMEPWYDQWLRAVGSAVIVGPTTFGGLISDVGVADMAPPMRLPCHRLRSRLTVLCDGTVTSCEQDVLGRQSLGRIGAESLSHIWRSKFDALRKTHADSRWKELLVCGRCSEWHRP